jgi:hypothetical protein
MTLSMKEASLSQEGEKRRTVITLSQSNQPAGCSFLRHAGIVWPIKEIAVPLWAVA